MLFVIVESPLFGWHKKDGRHDLGETWPRCRSSVIFYKIEADLEKM
jgi:hypothetical protein